MVLTLLAYLHGGSAGELSISPGIIIVHYDMGQSRIAQIGSDSSPILAKGFARFIQPTIVRYRLIKSQDVTHLSVTSFVGSEGLRPFGCALAAVSI